MPCGSHLKFSVIHAPSYRCVDVLDRASTPEGGSCSGVPVGGATQTCERAILEELRVETVCCSSLRKKRGGISLPLKTARFARASRNVNLLTLEELVPRSGGKILDLCFDLAVFSLV